MGFDPETSQTYKLTPDSAILVQIFIAGPMSPYILLARAIKKLACFSSRVPAVTRGPNAAERAEGIPKMNGGPFHPLSCDRTDGAAQTVAYRDEPTSEHPHMMATRIRRVPGHPGSDDFPLKSPTMRAPRTRTT